MHNAFLFWENLAILAKKDMEGLQLRMRLANQLYLCITFSTWHEVIDIYKWLLTSDTVYTPYTLHQTCWVPRCIIVQNDIGTVEVYTFSQYLCCNDDIVIVLPDTFVIGIKVLFNRMFHFVTIGSCNDKCFIALCLYCSCKRLNGINSFWEDDQLPRSILCRVKQFRLDVFFEGIKLRVLWVLCPSVIEVGNEPEVFF